MVTEESMDARQRGTAESIGSQTGGYNSAAHRQIFVSLISPSKSSALSCARQTSSRRNGTWLQFKLGSPLRTQIHCRRRRGPFVQKNRKNSQFAGLTAKPMSCGRESAAVKDVYGKRFNNIALFDPTLI